MKLRFTSCQAPNADGNANRIADYLSHRLGINFEYVNNRDWQAREAALFSGEIQVGWICGLPYVLEARKQEPSIQLLAAPVMEGERYEQRPIYFSDVVVRADSWFHKFADLRGKTWVYNESHSHSGYSLTRYMLAKKGLNGDFFGTRIEAGSHERAMRLLLRGKIDATALDSTVLETELPKDSDLADRIRVIDIWGPSPIPPWVIHQSLNKQLASDLRNEMIQMSFNDEGRAILTFGRISRFVEVADKDYDRIREMYKEGNHIEL